MRYLPTITILLLTLAACGRSEPNQGNTGNEKSPTGSLSGSSATPTPSASLPHSQQGIPEQGIPVSMRGRWGLVPADCKKGRSDAKGLMIVSPTTITFYESVGQISDINSSSDDKLDAQFAFSGEGMNWNRDVTFQLRDGGETLLRTDADESASSRFTYKRCSN
ncbi:hypothetical protein [Tsuneonella flava]|uniref:hypothetical protein n=1 Tax=Tsuneonella flava TaxID=2055955 RepID=UPI0018E46F6D|nr:hypothetical protein [Tsuneonella flava]